MARGIIELMEVISQIEIEEALAGTSKVRKLRTLRSEIRHDLHKLKGQDATNQALYDYLSGLIQEIDATDGATVIDGREL